MKGEGIYPGPGEDGLGRISFSEAEIAIIRLVCQGKNRGETAKALHMSDGRVKGIITGILNKTGFSSIMKFSVYAVAHGFIVPLYRE